MLNIESFGGFHVFWGQSVRGGVACFAAAIFLFSVSCIGFGFRSGRGRGWLST